MNDLHRLPSAVGLLVALLIGQAALSTAQAQLVQVGPGFVVAPFVRVYWGPDGSSYVRAPFVSVQSPGFAVQSPSFAAPSPGYSMSRATLPLDCRRMNWAMLVRTINESARQLDIDLTQISDGDVWRIRLGTKELAALAPADAHQPPPDEVRGQLQAALPAFDDAGGLPAADWVVGLGSYRTLQAALAEYTMPADLHFRRQVNAAAQDLQAALARFVTAASWQSYLALPPALAGASAGANLANSVPTQTALAETLARFGMVSQNDAYRMIAGLPAFHALHDSLTAYAAWLQLPPASPIVEELPAPSPDR